jgi:integrase/recombinase XerD
MELLSLPVTIDGSDVLRRAVAGTSPATRACRVPTPSPTCGCSWAGAPNAGSSHWWPSVHTSSSTSAGCRRYAGSSPPPCPDGSLVAGFYRTCVIDGVLPTSPAEHVRRPNVPPESPTLGLTHLQFEAMLTAARESNNPNDFALVAMLGLLGLRIFEATGADIIDLGEEHGHRVLKVHGKGDRIVLVPLPPAVGRALDRAVAGRTEGPLLRNQRGVRMDRHAATLRLRHLADIGGVRIARMHPHLLRHTFVTTMLDAGVDLRDVQIAARHADPAHHHALRPGPQQPRPTPHLHPRRIHGIRYLSEDPARADVTDLLMLEKWGLLSRHPETMAPRTVDT